MILRVGQTWLVQFRYAGTLGATVAPTLHVNGSPSVASVTLTTSTAGIIQASVSLAGLAVEDRVQLIGGSAVIDGYTHPLTSAEARITSIELTASAVRTELATELSRIDVTMSSRVADDDYVVPNNIGIAQLLSGVNVSQWGGSTLPSFLLASSYTAPDNAGITAIKAKTDQLTFTDSRVNANALNTVAVDEQAIADAVAGALSGVNVTVTTPVATDGTISIVQGDAYNGTIVLTASGIGHAEEGQTHTLRLLRRSVYERSGTNGEADTEVTVTATRQGNNAVASFTLSSADTASLDSVYPVDRNPQYVYQWLNATTGKTFAIGNVEVKRAILPEA